MKIRFWTVQKLDVVTALLQYGLYQPAFAYSDYIEENGELSDLYDFILNSYNQVNGTDCPGLVYTFLEGDEQGMVYDFKDYNSFRQFIMTHSFAIKSLWNHLAAKNTVILCVEKEIADENLLLIDINDFQYLMPPVIQSPPYSEEYYDFLVSNLAQGNRVRSIFPSNVLQAHIPNIKAKEVIGIYPMFDL